MAGSEELEPAGARAWLDSLPKGVSKQRAALERLLAAVELNPMWRWLEVGCSIAAGRGDELSDLDLGAGFAEESWPEVDEHLEALLTEVGDVADALHTHLPGMAGRSHRYVFAQFSEGLQVVLVVVPARASERRPPESIVLYDPGGLRAVPYEPQLRRADAAAIYEWTFQGWWALADMAKYLRRGSLWEAMERLHEMRTRVWRLWAAGNGVPYPAYGLTSVLDEPACGLPPNIESTVAQLDAADLRRAGMACGDLLIEVSAIAATWEGAQLPHTMMRIARTWIERTGDRD